MLTTILSLPRMKRIPWYRTKIQPTSWPTFLWKNMFSLNFWSLSKTLRTFLENGRLLPLKGLPMFIWYCYTSPNIQFSKYSCVPPLEASFSSNMSFMMPMTISNKFLIMQSILQCVISSIVNAWKSMVIADVPFTIVGKSGWSTYHTTKAIMIRYKNHTTS